MSKSRGRELVKLCYKQCDSDINIHEDVDLIHRRFNEEPFSYEMAPNNDTLLLPRPCLFDKEVDCIEEAPNVSSFDQDEKTYQESKTSQQAYETSSKQGENFYGDVLIEHDNGIMKTIQVLENIQSVCVERIDLQVRDKSPIFLSDNNKECDIQNNNNCQENEEVLLQEIHSGKNIHEPDMIKKTSRKRNVDKKNWKFQKTKIARQSGKEYITQNGKTVKEKTVCKNMLCKCKLQCSSHFLLEERSQLLSEYYSLCIEAKNSILFKSITMLPVKRRVVAATKERNHTFTYHVKKRSNENIRVCKKAFINLFQITVRKVSVIQEKHISGQLIPKNDMRGKHSNRPNKIKPEIIQYVMDHIASFPSEQSHYSRNVNPNKLYLSPLLNVKSMYRLYIEMCQIEKKEGIYCVKECTYRNIFTTKFNLSFGLPKSDVCSRCENKDSVEDLDSHIEAYKAAYDLMKNDRNQCSMEENNLYCTVDIQQTMPLPKLPVGEAFYLRQIWFYNLGIHLASKQFNHPIMCTWTEDVAKKGSFEVACALQYLALYLQSSAPTINHLIIWSDSCSGQNKNFNIICLYQYLILKKYFKVIEHKFPIVGHTYMDSDRDFGRIEKALRKHEKIYTPEEYRDIIKNNTTKNSVVVDMSHQLYNIDEIQGQLKLVNRNKNTLGQKIDFRDEIRWIKIDEFGSFLYKKSYDPNTPFLKVNLLRKGYKYIPPCNIELRRLTTLRGEVSQEKIADVRKLIKYVPLEKRFYYENILK